MKSIFFICIMFISTAFTAQSSGAFLGSNQLLENGSFSSLNSHFGNIKAKGTSLMFKDFKNQATLTLTSGETYNISNINMNLDKGTFVAEIGKDSLFIFKNVKKAVINNKKYILVNNSIYQVLESGKNISFLIKHTKVIKRQVQNKLSAEELKWKHNEDYYVKINNNFEEINLKKKDFFNFLDANNIKNLKAFIKNNRLKVKKEKDLITIFKHYNTL